MLARPFKIDNVLLFTVPDAVFPLIHNGESSVITHLFHNGTKIIDFKMELEQVIHFYNMIVTLDKIDVKIYRLYDMRILICYKRNVEAILCRIAEHFL